MHQNTSFSHKNLKKIGGENTPLHMLLPSAPTSYIATPLAQNAKKNHARTWTQLTKFERFGSAMRGCFLLLG